MLIHRVFLKPLFRFSFNSLLAVLISLVAFNSFPLFAQQTDDLKIDSVLPNSVLKLGNRKQEVLDDFRARAEQLSDADQIPLLEEIVAIETKAIQLLEEPSSATIDELAEVNADPPHLLSSYLGGTISNGKFLAALLEKVGDLDKSVTVRRVVVQRASKLHGIDHWETGLVKRELAQAEWKLNATPERRQQFDDAVAAINTGLEQRNTGNLDQAQTLYEQGITILKQLALTESETYSTALYNLAQALEESGKVEDAEAGYLAVVAAEEKILGNNSPSFAQTMYSLAGFYRQNGARFQKGLEAMQRSYDINVAAYGPQAIQVARSLHGIGRLQHDLQNYAAATDSYSAAFKMLNGLDEKNSRLSLDILDSQKALYEEIGLLGDAETIADIKVDIASAVYGSNSVQAAESLYEHAAIHRAMKDFARAEELFILSKVRFESQENFESAVGYISCLEEMGLTLRSMGRLSESKPIAKKAADLAEKLAGKESLIYAIKSQTYSIVLAELNEFEEAQARLDEAMAVIEKLLGTNNPDYVTSYSNQAYFQLLQKNYDQATKLWLEQSEMVRDLYGEQSTEYVFALDLVSDTYRKNGDEANAEKFAVQSAALTAAFENTAAPEDQPVAMPDEMGEEAATDSAAGQPMDQATQQQLQARLDEMIAIAESGDVDKLLAELVSPEELSAMKEAGRYESIKTRFAESKLPELLAALKSIDVTQGVLNGDTVVFESAQPRPMTWKKENGRWHIRN